MEEGSGQVASLIKLNGPPFLDPDCQESELEGNLELQ